MSFVGLWSRLPESVVSCILDLLQPTVDEFIRLQHASKGLRSVAWPCARGLLLPALLRGPGAPPPSPSPSAPLRLPGDSAGLADARPLALAALGRLGWLTGDPGALEAAASLIMEDDPRVQLAAAAALVRVAGPHHGSAQALASLWPCLRHASGAVRSSALAALGGIAERGHRGAVAAARSALHDPCAPVRVAALGVLRRIAPEGAPEVLQDVASCLEDSSEAVRNEAADVLAAVAGSAGGRAALAALLPRLGRGVPSAAAALAGLAGCGPDAGAHAVAALCGAMRREASGADARCALLDALAQIVTVVKPLCLLEPSGDCSALAAMTEALAAPEQRVRCAAVDALGQHASVGSRATVAALAAALRRASCHKRLHRSACGRGPTAIAVAAAAAARNLSEAAAKAFRCIVEAGDADATVAVSACLEDDCCEVQVAAMKGLLELAVKGYQDIQRLFKGQLASFDTKKRRLAASALGHVLVRKDGNDGGGEERECGGAACGAAFAVGALWAAAADPAAEVQREALKLLALLAASGRRHQCSCMAAASAHRWTEAAVAAPRPPPSAGAGRLSCCGSAPAAGPGCYPPSPAAALRGRARRQRQPQRRQGAGCVASGGSGSSDEAARRRAAAGQVGMNARRSPGSSLLEVYIV